ncbi:MMPL family transporter [Nitrosomonas communis]|uniref:MMPL family transporter n=1 Tax=Nitrosomonas communis TaxID=44574 RepID=UPI003D29A781
MGARLVNFLEWLENWLLRFPKTLIFLMLMLCVVSVYYAVHNLRIDTDTTKILSNKLPFLQDRERFLKAFPQDNEAILVVIDAPIPERTSEALNYLKNKFSQDTQNIQSIFIPGEGKFFERHGLLYLDLEKLHELVNTLAEAQPFIGVLADDNSLSSLFSIIERAITTTTEDQKLPVDLNPLLEKISNGIQAVIKDENYQLSWQQLIFGENEALLSTQCYMLLKPKLDFTAVQPSEVALNSIRTIVKTAKTQFPDVRVRLTGEVVLENDELESIEQSTLIASSISLLLVCLLLLIGLKSVRLVLITFTLLVIGLALTAGFATLAVGHLNLISISFAVLYIGISDDFTVQILLRYRELQQQNLTQAQALAEAIRKVGPSITLCAITTTAGFFSFIPTAYVGVSELGVIAGGGIVIALIVSLIMLPALLILFPLNPAKVQAEQNIFPQWVYHFPIQHRIAIKWSALVLTLAGAMLLTQVRFDFNPLNLRDPESESLSTFRELLETKNSSPLTLTTLANSKQEVLNTVQKLEALDSVESVVTIFNFLPNNQEEKLTIMQDLSLILGLYITSFPPLREDSLERNEQALRNFLASIDRSLAANTSKPRAENLHRLHGDLQRLMEVLGKLPLEERAARLTQLQWNLLGTLNESMNRLLMGLQADTVTLSKLPGDLAERWLNPEGIYRIQIFPKKNLNDQENLKDFIADVRTVAPHATDLPVIYLESGNAVVSAFQEALIYALTTIFLVVLVMHRSLKDTVLILLPLLIMAILIGASTVLLDIAFNFANIIVIPLLLGLGVNSGIYIMHRLHSMPNKEQDVLKTSTARGVILGNLTTLCSFVSMAFSPHLGLASMGLLLSIGLTLIILISLLVLPAFACKSANH